MKPVQPGYSLSGRSYIFSKTFLFSFYFASARTSIRFSLTEKKIVWNRLFFPPGFRNCRFTHAHDFTIMSLDVMEPIVSHRSTNWPFPREIFKNRRARSRRSCSSNWRLQEYSYWSIRGIICRIKNQVSGVDFCWKGRKITTKCCVAKSVASRIDWQDGRSSIMNARINIALQKYRNLLKHSRLII